MRNQAQYKGPRRTAPSSGGAFLQVIVVFVVVLALLLGLASFSGLLPGFSPSPRPDASSPQEFPPIAGIPCEDPVEDGFSAQALLVIRVEGSRATVPGGIGKRTACRYWLYTANSQGVIHVDAPAQQSFTLGQFFDIWLEPLDDQRIGQHVASGEQSVVAFVDGERWSDNPRTIPLNNGTTIELQLGTTPEEPLEVPFPSQ